MSKQGCVVVSLHKDRDILHLVTKDGVIVVETSPNSGMRTKVYVRAPLDVQIVRRKKEAQS
jgi:hypothetical protein